MGNYRLEHCRSRVNTIPPIVSKVEVLETRRQHVKIGVTESLDACITTTRVEMVVAPNINVVRKGILIGFIVRLGSGSSGVSARRNLNQNFAHLKWCLIM